MADIFMEMQGGADLMAQLSGMSKSARNKIVKPALAAGAKIVAKAVRRHARGGLFKSDTMAKMVKVKVWNSKRRRGETVAKVYADERVDKRTVKVQGRNVPFAVVANIQEYGKKDGSLPPHPFFRPGYAESKDSAMLEIERVAKEKLAEAAK
jgi:hypothetical protein